MKSLRLIILIYYLVTFILYVGCENQKDVLSIKEKGTEKQISIVTTTTQVTDLVTRLVGDSCHVKPLMGPGIDPHSYKPTALDMTAISTADMIIYHGLKLEGKFANHFSYERNNQLKTYAVASIIPDELLLMSDEDNTAYPDPHIWFSPVLWQKCLQGLSDYLIEQMPELKEKISSRRNLIEREIGAVAEWAQIELNSIPEKKRILITSHDAFRYLGKYFRLEVIALQGISTLQEAGLLDRSILVDFINDKEVKCLFVESSVNPKALQEIAKETGASLGQPLFSDALGSSKGQSVGPNQKTYAHNSWEGMMVYNILTIVNGLTP